MHSPYLLLVAVLESGEVLQELHAQTAPLLSLLVSATTEWGGSREGRGGERGWEGQGRGEGEEFMINIGQGAETGTQHAYSNSFAAQVALKHAILPSHWKCMLQCIKIYVWYARPSLSLLLLPRHAVPPKEAHTTVPSLCQ